MRPIHYNGDDDFVIIEVMLIVTIYPNLIMTETWKYNLYCKNPGKSFKINEICEICISNWAQY